MKILAFDTSGPVASVALAEDERLIGGFRLQSGFTHSQTLMPMLESMGALSGTDMNTVDYIAVASGPGSFTGLRIGASTAKGLCFALGKPIVPVPTLAAMAFQMEGTSALVCPMMDARRQQVYTGVYTFQKGKMENVLTDRAIPVSELTAELNRLANTCQNAETETGEPLVYVLGDGVPVYMEELQKELTVPFACPAFHRDRQSAEAVCALAFQLVREGKAMDASAFSPEYLRSGPQPAV